MAPSEGEVWIPGSGATGAWAGQTGRLAAWQGGGWVFVSPGTGWRAWNKATGLPLVHEGGIWVAKPAPLPVLQNLSGIGVGTTSDAGNPLAVAGAATPAPTTWTYLAAELNAQSATAIWLRMG